MCKGINLELVACIAWRFKQFLQQSERERLKRRSREDLICLSPRLLTASALVTRLRRFLSALK